MNAYVKYFCKYLNLLVNYKDILEKCNKIWNKIESLLKKRI